MSHPSHGVVWQDCGCRKVPSTDPQGICAGCSATPVSLPCCRLHKKKVMHIWRKGEELKVALVKFKALTLSANSHLHLKSWQNAWLNQKAKCEHVRARRAQREARSSVLKSCLTSEGSGSLLPHIPGRCQNIVGETSRDGATCPGVRRVSHLGCAQGRHAEHRRGHRLCCGAGCGGELLLSTLLEI